MSVPAGPAGNPISGRRARPVRLERATGAGPHGLEAPSRPADPRAECENPRLLNLVPVVNLLLVKSYADNYFVWDVHFKIRPSGLHYSLLSYLLPRERDPTLRVFQNIESNLFSESFALFCYV